MNKVDTSNWKEYKISEIFETETDKSKTKNLSEKSKGKWKNKTQIPTGAQIPKKYLTDGDIARITVTGINNGVAGHYKKIEHPNYRVFNNFISVSFLGTIFYHPYQASLDMKVHCLKLKNKELNSNIALFLISVIRKYINCFAYDDQLSSTVLPTLSILLPTKDNKPDWEYMENYIKNLFLEETKKAEILIKAYKTI